MIGWEDNFVHELLHFLTCIKEDAAVGPRGATMEDGYRCAEICDAIVRSHETGQRQELSYRSL
jgi:predicted dehydrogenase